jgi:hypothetical protein
MEDKLKMLAEISGRLNEAGVEFAIGSSMLLYLNGLVDEARDIDLFINGESDGKAIAILRDLGEVRIKPRHALYTSSSFCTLVCDATEVDIIADFGVVNADCMGSIYISRESIEREILLHGEIVPLMYLEDWMEFYQLMGRTEKVELLTEYFQKHHKSPRTGFMKFVVEGADA